ncbi:MAG: hypothetical protein RBS27_12380 [Giesbergeria sp.]|jgi:cell division protein FtsW (lipid II flippase)|nr:hypothetical protein [Giesbergeria sp.]
MPEPTPLQRVMPSQRSLWHSLAAVTCTLGGTYLASRYLQAHDAMTDALDWMEQVLLSIIPTAVGMAIILVSWLAHDARAHHKPYSWVITTAVLGWFSLGLAMFGYLFFTRSGSLRWIAMAQFGLLLLLLVLVLAQTMGLTLSSH